MNSNDYVDFTPHEVIFHSNNSSAVIRVTWEPAGSKPGQLDKDKWFNRLSSNSNVLSIDNQSRHIANQPALTAIATHGIDEGMFIIAYIPIKIGTHPSLPIFYEFRFVYMSNSSDFPTYVNVFQNMVSKFHVNG